MALWVPMFVWWLAFLPGGISNDSVSIWGYVQTGHWQAHHPVPYTAFVWLTSGAGTSIAVTTLVQTVLMAAALAGLAAAVGDATGARRWPWAAAFLLAALPLLGALSVVVWKDVMETAALLWLAALLIRAAERQAAPTRAWWVALAAASLGAALMRWNGVGTVLVAAAVTAWALPRGRRVRGAVVMAVAAGVGFGVLWVTPHVFPIEPLRGEDTVAEQMSDLARLAHVTPQSFTVDDRAVLERMAPFRAWQRVGYNCYSVGPVTYYLLVPWDAITATRENVAAIKHVWSDLLHRKPATVLGIRVCRASLAWSLSDPPHSTITTLQRGIVYNTAGLHQQSWRPLRDAMTSYSNWSSRRLVQELLWRPALWLLIVAGLALLGWRRGWRLPVAGLAVPIGAVVSYAVAPAAQDARYTYAAVVVCQVVAVGYVGSGLSSMLTRSSRSRRRSMPSPTANQTGA